MSDSKYGKEKPTESEGYWDEKGYYYEHEGYYDPDGNYYVYADEGELAAGDTSVLPDVSELSSEEFLASENFSIKPSVGKNSRGKAKAEYESEPVNRSVEQAQAAPRSQDSRGSSSKPSRGLSRGSGSRNRSVSRSSNDRSGSSNRNVSSRQPLKSSSRAVSEEASRPAVKKSASLKKRRAILIGFASALLIIIFAGAFIAYNNMTEKSKENYDSQMEIAAEEYAAGHIDEAITAYKNALSYKPDDLEASIALCDIYLKTGKDEEALALLLNLKDKHPEDTRIYERLYPLYIDVLGDIDAANELTVFLNAHEIAYRYKLVPTDPDIDPAGGRFEKATEVTMSADEGCVIYYTMDGSEPTVESKTYENAIKLSANEDTLIAAIAISDLGLKSLVTNVSFTIDVQFMLDVSTLDNIGKTHAKIADKEGALFFKGYEEGGYYYQPKNGRVYYIFPADSFNNIEPEEPVEPAEGEETPPIKEIDPQTTPLPSGAVCVAVRMLISDYVSGLSGKINIEDFCHGVGIEKYSVDKNMSGGYSLFYTKDGLSYMLDLADKETIDSSKEMTVKK